MIARKTEPGKIFKKFPSKMMGEDLQEQGECWPLCVEKHRFAECKGWWITGQDADDWAMPQRLEKHLEEAVEKGYDASITFIVRTDESG